MRCPKCGYVSFDTLAACGKCGENLVAVAEVLAGTAVKVESNFFLASVVSLGGASAAGELAEALAALPVAEEEPEEELAEEPGPAEADELLELGGAMGGEEEGIAMPEMPTPEPPAGEGVPMIDLSPFLTEVAPEPAEADPGQGQTLEGLAGESATETLELAEAASGAGELELTLAEEPLTVAEAVSAPEEEEPGAEEFTLVLDDLMADEPEMGEAGANSEESEPVSRARQVDLEEIDLSDLVAQDAPLGVEPRGQEGEGAGGESAGGELFTGSDQEGGDDILDLDFVLGGAEPETMGGGELQGIDLSPGGQNDIFDLLLEMGEEEAKPKKEEAAAPPEIPDLGLTLEKDPS